MLKITINNKNMHAVYTKLNCSNIIKEENDELRVFCKKHMLSDNVFCKKHDGDVEYSENFTVESYSNDEFVINYPEKRILFVDNVIKYGNYLIFTLRGDSYHTQNVDRTTMRSDHYYEENTFLDDIEFLQPKCENFPHLSGYFFIQNNEIINTKAFDTFSFLVDYEIKDIYAGKDIKKNIGDEILLPKCYVGALSGGYDNNLRFIWEIDDTIIPEVIDYLLNNVGYLTFYEKRNDFLKILPNNEVIFLKNTYFAREDGNIRVNLPLGETFANNLAQEDEYSNKYIERVINKNINPIIDYEKKVFEPVYINDDTYHFMKNGNIMPPDEKKLFNIRNIKFDLHFRERDYTDDSWNLIESDDGDIHLWNDMEIDGDGNINDYNDKADLLGYLGFEDEDVYFQKNKLKKSFIRLLFYDTMDRNRQSLYFYATIFLDSNSLYSKYVALKRDLVKMDEGGYVFTEPENCNLRLGCSFSCSDKYNTEASSEGFYLYLFPKLIKGTLPSKLYMKVEFNHAKYGRKIPMIMPTDENNVPLDIKDPRFPKDYTKTDEDGLIHIDMNKLNSDMYMEIGIKYDYTNNRHIWFLPRNMGNNGETLTFNLFEPII